MRQPLYDFMKELNHSFDVTERKDYLQRWPGFGNVFGTKMTELRGIATFCSPKRWKPKSTNPQGPTSRWPQH